MTNTLARPEVIQLPSQETGLSLADLKQIVVRRWKPALAVGVIAFTGVFIPTLIETPKYQSKTSILLDSGKNKQSASVMPEQQAASYYNLKDFSTEIMILHSYSLIALAMKDFPETFTGLTISEVIEDLSITQAMVGEVPTDILNVAFTHSDPQKAKAVLEALATTYVKYSLERQRSQATNAIDFIREQLPRSQKEVDEAAKAIRQFRQTHNMVDPNEYALTVGSFKQTLEQQAKEAEIALSRTERQYQETSRQLAELGQNPDTALVYTVLGQDQVYQSLAAQLKELETQYALGSVDFHDSYHVMENIQLRRAELQKLLQQRAKQLLGDAFSKVRLDQVIVSQAGAIPTPGIESTVTSGGEASGAETTTSQSTNSQLGTSASTLQTLTHQLLSLQTELAALNSQLEGIYKAKLKVETDFTRIPELQQNFAELQRQFTVKSEAVNYLLKRQQELEIAAAEETAPWQVLDAPYLPGKPSSPDIERGLTVALAAGVCLGAATAWLLQQLDQKVRLVEEVKQITRLPLLGTIPDVEYPLVEINPDQNQEFRSYQYSSFTEGLRALAMNLRYLMVESGRIKSLAFTSSTSSEGKTTVTYNLSLVLAELGFRVLVVDADLRKPRLHKLSKLPNEQGLSNAIISDEPWSNFVQTGVVENLHIMTSGNTSPNPIALLNSEKTRQLIQEWQESYDYLLIDTPPIGVMADAKSVASQVDATLFVAGIGRVSSKAVENSLEILHNTRCNLAGFVANRVNRDFDYYAYSYYDSYYNQTYTSSNSNGNGNGHHPEGITHQSGRG